MNKKIISCASYLNADKFKKVIFKENVNKSGIYCWTNLINSKSYVGSAYKLNRRLSDYYCIDKFKRIRIKGNSMISNAILKYGIANFSLDILEYCGSNIMIEREQYYIDLLKPEYNICKIAYSALGRRLSEEAKINLSIKHKGVNNPFYGKTHTDEVKSFLSEFYRGANNPMYGKTHTEETKLKIRMSLLKTHEKKLKNKSK